MPILPDQGPNGDVRLVLQRMESQHAATRDLINLKMLQLENDIKGMTLVIDKGDLAAAAALLQNNKRLDDIEDRVDKTEDSIRAAEINLRWTQIVFFIASFIGGGAGSVVARLLGL